MSALTIVAPGPYMTMNDREHWRPHAQRVALWRLTAATAARYNWLTQQPRCTLHFEFDVPDRRRRDPHNYYPTIKAIVDGLVDAKLWPDDTPEYVATTEPTFNVVRRDAVKCVTVTLTERAL